MTDFYDRIARYYDIENQHFTEDLTLYEDLAENFGDPILDVGSGNGRVNLYLSGLGHQTVGVDTSAEMLAVAQRKINGVPHLRDHARLVQADILKFDEGTYPLILLPYNALMHFTEQETQLALLVHLATLLNDEGRIVIDLPNAGEAYAAEDEVGMVLERKFILPDSGNLVMQQSVSSIDRANQLLYVDWIYDEIEADGTLKRTLAPIMLRYVFLAELQLLLNACGLVAENVYGDYDESPFENGCRRLIVVAHKQD